MLLTEKGGAALDGSAFAEKTLERYRMKAELDPGGAAQNGTVLKKIRIKNKTRDKTEALVIIPAGRPTLKLYFTIGEEAKGAFQLYPASCRFLSSGLSGWNEWAMELAGSGKLSVSGEGLITSFTGLETVDFSGGSIRRDETRLTGGEALTALRNRKGRLDALAAWMKQERMKKEGPPDFQSQKDFENFWKPILLPEMVPRKKRPPGYDEENAEWGRAEGVKWNAAYSAGRFPEDIAELRNSGALLRDWEEALPWLFLLSEWDDMMKKMETENLWIKTKK